MGVCVIVCMTTAAEAEKERVHDAVAGATVLENPTEELKSSTTKILH